MKKKTIAIAAMLLAASLCFGLAACGSGVSLKDFPAETEETAELGSVYELRTQVEGEDGTTYRLSSQVVTQDGGAVPVFENSFDVSDVSGYTITYTALISDTETQQSVVTLSVTDNTAPVININKPDDGIVNTEYRLPEISVSDLAGSCGTYRAGGQILLYAFRSRQLSDRSDGFQRKRTEQDGDAFLYRR